MNRFELGLIGLHDLIKEPAFEKMAPAKWSYFFIFLFFYVSVENSF